MTEELKGTSIKNGIYRATCVNMGSPDPYAPFVFMVTVYYEDGRVIDSHKFARYPNMSQPLPWNIYTMENDITIQVLINYRQPNARRAMFIPNFCDAYYLESVDISMDVNPAVSFKRSSVLTCDQLRQIVTEYREYEIGNKEIYDLVGDLAKVHNIIRMVDLSSKISPNPFIDATGDMSLWIPSIPSIRGMLNDISNSISNQIDHLQVLREREIQMKRKAMDEEIRMKRKYYRENGYAIPDFYSGGDCFYGVDIGDPNSSSYQKWEQSGRIAIHAIKLG